MFFLLYNFNQDQLAISVSKYYPFYKGEQNYFGCNSIDIDTKLGMMDLSERTRYQMQKWGLFYQMKIVYLSLLQKTPKT